MIIPAVKKTIKGKVILNMPEMTFEDGRLYAVIGANGSGKTTYARILAGTLSSDGRVRAVPKGHLVGYLPQHSYAFRMSVKANIALGGRDAARAEALSERLGLTSLLKQSAKLLSGGETARMALARLLMRDCKLLILDEPTVSMDMDATLTAEEIIRDYCRKTGCTLIMITHSLSQAERVADDILFMSAGEPVELADAKSLLYAPRDERTREFLRFSGKG